MAQLYVVGIGPGDLNHCTPAAEAALAASSVIVGYGPYLKLIETLTEGKELCSSGMMKEVDRCRIALQRASGGETTSLVSSGDPGIYGMAGLALELADGMESPPEICIVPGVSALQAAAAVLGAPLMHDSAIISLSDLLTPWELIRKRLSAAAEADFVIALYNPKSKGRVTQIAEAREIILRSRSGSTPVGIVRNALRNDQQSVVTDLDCMLEHEIDMFTTVLIGNSSTRIDRAGRMVTPRGYKRVQGIGDRVEGTGNQRTGDRVQGIGNQGEDYRVQGFKPYPLHPVPSTLPSALMLCGTGSDVGKSVLTAGLCRVFANRGVKVAPFKSQNMALNSAVTPEGGEIGRAQAVQAEACRIPPHTDMNPVLLKPTSDVGSQVIVQGTVVGTMKIGEYNRYKPTAFRRATESFQRLASKHELLMIEGAGSIAEINLKADDIANMAVARMADCPVIVVADIDRGGVFAQIVGTWELLESEERERVAGFIINKFRGDPSLLASGLSFIQERTGRPVLGVVPWLPELRLPEEDSMALQKRGMQGKRSSISIGVVKIPRISNFTDFDPLDREPDVSLHYIESPLDLIGIDALILPGSKSTIADLYFLMESGIYRAIQEFNGLIAGICGGFQMLGTTVRDPDHLDSSIDEAEGLGLLDVETVMLPGKQTHQVDAVLTGGAPYFSCPPEISGYEIHLGRSTLASSVRPFATITRRSSQGVSIEDGAVSRDGRVFGTYLHGIFDNHLFRTAFLNRIRYSKGLELQHRYIELDDPFDRLADHLVAHLDMDRIFSLSGIAR